jgi:CRISPR-associated protein Cas1
MEQVVVEEFGSFLGKESERLVIKEGRETLREVPLFRIQEIIVGRRGVTLSSDLLAEACRRGIRIAFLDPSGHPYALLTSPLLTATVASRRAQMEAYGDERSVTFSRAVVEGKLRNQSALIKYFGKYWKEREPSRFQALTECAKELDALRRKAKKVTGPHIEAVRPELLGLEGAGGRTYWEAVRHLLGPKVAFRGRQARGAKDPVNSLLNYGYGILYTQVWGALMNAGLEPFAGFLHVDRPGKPSLVLDLIEEFRQPVVDRAVFALLNQGFRAEMDSEGWLAPRTRQALAERVLRRLDTRETFEGRRWQLRSIIQRQARHLASFLRGERTYRPFKSRW